MTADAGTGIFGEPVRGRIGVLIEEHFDQTEFLKFNDFFPAHGYQVVYLSHLWGNPSLHFRANPDDGRIGAEVTVTTEVETADIRDYRGILLIGAYATDRLRYQANPRKGQPNMAPAVRFLRRAVATPGLKTGTICHSLWLFCADRSLLAGRRVTCAHNIICDVENAGGEVVYDGDQTAELVIDGDLISGKHPGMVDSFMRTYIAELEKVHA
ncbi:Thiamine biosynthesis protein ThiJ [Rhodovastum atsumiense]|uniref:Thiamine biosynthesis protein ThiJ n=1 Tax=Rhodovastum atsumiense TaxID=504468 RepID=A0A5M6IM56_9PROT|nr:DJ-1/PfpI family protein [Rhodovastum atsumiense]KAA5609331.1 thiamine biosynthesis protein ThiJ [Rhodovastum atsumiense]CAH2602369.1 Thiamine biosynthesis protein ThiJ [Rhodovastum atsumiense]